MDKVDFLENNDTEFHIKSRKLFGEPTTPTMIAILLKTGLAKNEKQALYILIGVVIVSILLTVVIAQNNFSPKINTPIIDQAGNSYTLEEYVSLVKQGKDPLLAK